MDPLNPRLTSVTPLAATMVGAGIVAVTAAAVSLFFLSQGHDLFSIRVTVCGGVGIASLAVFAIASVMACLRKKQSKETSTPPSLPAPLSQAQGAPHERPQSAHDSPVHPPILSFSPNIQGMAGPVSPSVVRALPTSGFAPIAPDLNLSSTGAPTIMAAPVPLIPTHSSSAHMIIAVNHSDPAGNVHNGNAAPGSRASTGSSTRSASAMSVESVLTLRATGASRSGGTTPRPSSVIRVVESRRTTPTPFSSLVYEADALPQSPTHSSRAGTASITSFHSCIRSSLEEASSLPHELPNEGSSSGEEGSASELATAHSTPTPLHLENGGVPISLLPLAASAIASAEEEGGERDMEAAATREDSLLFTQAPANPSTLVPAISDDLTEDNDVAEAEPSTAGAAAARSTSSPLHLANGDSRISLLPLDASPSSAASAEEDVEEEIEVVDIIHAEGVPQRRLTFTQVPANLSNLGPSQLDILIDDIAYCCPNPQQNIEALISQLMTVFVLLASKEGSRYSLKPIETSFQSALIGFLYPFASTSLTASLLIWSAFNDDKSSVVTLIERALQKTIDKLKFGSLIRSLIRRICETELELDSHYASVASDSWLDKKCKSAASTVNKAKRYGLEKIIAQAIPSINSALPEDQRLSEESLKKIEPFVISFFVQYRTKGSPLMTLFQEALDGYRTGFTELYSQSLSCQDFAQKTFVTATQQTARLFSKVNPRS